MKKTIILENLQALNMKEILFLKRVKSFLNLAGNDYLNLSFCKSLKDEFLDNIKEQDLFFSSSSSRSLSGNFTIYEELESF